MSNLVRSSHAVLSQFSSCEISDALIKLGLPHGGHIPDIHLFSPSDPGIRICGPAYTVKIVLASDAWAPKLEKHFVDEAPPDSVIIIDAPPRTNLPHPLQHVAHFATRGEISGMGWPYGSLFF